MWNICRGKHPEGSSTSSKASCVFRWHCYKLSHFDTRLLWQFLKCLVVGRSKLLFCAIVLQLISSVRISCLSFYETLWEKAELLGAHQWCGGRPDLNTPSDTSEQNVVWTGAVEYLSNVMAITEAWEDLCHELLSWNSECERRANDWT